MMVELANWLMFRSEQASFHCVLVQSEKTVYVTTSQVMTPLPTQLVVISMRFILLLNHLELETRYKCELFSETETTLYT